MMRCKDMPCPVLEHCVLAERMVAKSAVHFTQDALGKAGDREAQGGPCMHLERNLRAEYMGRG